MLTKISHNGSQWLFKGFCGEDWRWRLAAQPDSRDFIRGWMPAVVPGCVLQDLWKNQEIPDPYFERNSLLSEWACQRTWLYRTHFTSPISLQGQDVRLVLKGIDYQAEVFLNGESLGDHTGMFTPAIFDVSNRLHYGEENLLVVVIAPAPQEQPQVGRSSLVRTHKARMNYWWDFCPRLVHQGIWDDVYLESSAAASFGDIFIRPLPDIDAHKAVARMECRVNSRADLAAKIDVIIRLGENIVATSQQECTLTAGESQHRLEIPLEEPQWWWPNGYGEQPLYNARAELRIADTGTEVLSDVGEVKFGIREIRMVANYDAPPGALPYTLQVNGKRIYAKGWNWVPMDALYGVERPEKLAHLLKLAKQANVNLLRVWGGGLIEKEAFYDLCDRLGILIWQEFIQSSSGIDNNPPEDADFIAFMVSQARQILPSRRNHPSLAIWCGGNELSRGDSPLDDTHPMLAALKQVVRDLSPDSVWLPTSSSGPVFGNSIEEIEKRPEQMHDIHGPWEYQGLQAQYDLYNRGCSLFHSEFGVEGITNWRSLLRTLSPENLFPVDRNNSVWFHLGAWWVKEAMWRTVFGEFQDIQQAQRATQFLQYEGLRYAVEADRRRWPGNSGSIPWQFNEPFPMAACTSAVDYYGQPKPAYYAVSHAYKPVHLSARYERLAWGGCDTFSAGVWLSCDHNYMPFKGRVEWAVQSMHGQVLEHGERALDVIDQANDLIATLRLATKQISTPLFFLTLRLKDESGQVTDLNRYLFCTQHNMSAIFDLPGTELSLIDIQKGEKRQVLIRNSGRFTAFYVWLEGKPSSESYDYIYMSDNYFCLLPGEERIFTVLCHNQQQVKLQVGAWNSRVEEIE